MTSYYRIVKREWDRKPWLPWSGVSAEKYRAWIKDPARNERSNRWWWRVQEAKAILLGRNQ